MCHRMCDYPPCSWYLCLTCHNFSWSYFSRITLSAQSKGWFFFLERIRLNALISQWENPCVRVNRSQSCLVRGCSLKEKVLRSLIKCIATKQWISLSLENVCVASSNCMCVCGFFFFWAAVDLASWVQRLHPCPVGGVQPPPSIWIDLDACWKPDCSVLCLVFIGCDWHSLNMFHIF